MTDTFVWMYHPSLGNRQVRVSLGSVDDHAAKGWLLVDPGVTPPAPSTPYTTVAQVASQLSSGTGPIGLAGRAASVAAVQDAITDGDIIAGGTTVTLDGQPLSEMNATAVVAADIPFTPSGTVAGTNVQAAINELMSEINAQLAAMNDAIVALGGTPTATYYLLTESGNTLTTEAGDVLVLA